MNSDLTFITNEKGQNLKGIENSIGVDDLIK